MQLNSREGTNELRRRLLLCGVGVAGMFAGIGLRLYRLQVGQGETWRSLSENNRIRLQRLTATRGLIYDRNGEPLVDNRASFDVVVVPEDTKDLAETIRRVARFLRVEDA